ncbi:AraC family transcriptional regulator [uncultured Chryseobacterium sp.]|uniref:helix-turn-helix domain-containing protein n=1 Tax=uncultured Chryseobacterium sp. TaxID=259322 RepID=UPI0025FC8547|nr:helix-turn-helix transcriptional regulator [uncultured Chryseobacterium sp.]
MDHDDDHGISVARTGFRKNDFRDAHRDEGYTFHILEQGTVNLEIDFRQYRICAPSVVYMHPAQVHRIIHFENITICSLSMKDENLDPDSVRLLEDIAPAEPLVLTAENNRTLFHIFEICLHFYSQKNNTLHNALLKHSCNTLVSFVISQFQDHQKPEAALSRSETITKAFRKLLEKNYRRAKRPGDYADQLHISTAYLNECVKNATGVPVSQHIRDRIILEAKRRLYHTDQSVKEISFELGFDDYPYFSRLFKKATGMSALSFRNKNRD